ncbi:MAG TPA: magnesium transporter CorA family protein [Candidatus Acidoferrum sp.]|nr:magnesium transporter CorA family protein [Candidatus Acidoferrum sp.]
MTWHDVADLASPRLDELARVHTLHRLHVEDCRQKDQRTKVDIADHYLFILIKTPLWDDRSNLQIGGLGLFVGSDFLITVHENALPLLDSLRALGDDLRSDQVLYRLLDGIVDSYLPLIDRLEENIQKLQDDVIESPCPHVLERIGEMRGMLLRLRRVLTDTRRVAFQLRHIESPIIKQDLLPFLRDVHDDLAIDIDTITSELERLTSVLDLYFSGIANRTTEATRTLTLLGTIAVPTIVITSFFGMNIAYPSWTKSPWAFAILVGVTAVITGVLLWYLKRHDYLPGGNTLESARLRTRPNHVPETAREPHYVETSTRAGLSR